MADRLQNPQNWSRSRKLLVTSLICILNFGIYIGSSIYTPGEQDIMEEFGVSEVVATLGLSLFVLYVYNHNLNGRSKKCVLTTSE